MKIDTSSDPIQELYKADFDEEVERTKAELVRKPILDQAAKYVASQPKPSSQEIARSCIDSLARDLIKGYGLTIDEARKHLSTYNAQHCRPYFSIDELQAIMQKAFDSPVTAGYLLEGNKPLTTPAIEILDSYVQKLMDGTVEQLTKLGTALDGIEVGPGLLTVIGAPPGAGKTCLTMQVAFEALGNNPDLVVTIANAETTFEGLLRREFIRMTGIYSRKLRFADLDDNDRRKILQAQTELRPLVDRIRVVDDCTLESLVGLASQPPGMIVVDYLQKFVPGGDSRLGVVAVMAQCRHLAKKGWTVIALSATTRTQNGKGGSSHDSSKLGQSSFRDSSDIEFNADSCYLLVDQGPVNSDELQRSTLLKCVKNRHDRKEDRELRFDMPRQRFNLHVTYDSISQIEFNAFGSADDE